MSLGLLYVEMYILWNFFDFGSRFVFIDSFEL